MTDVDRAWSHPLEQVQDPGRLAVLRETSLLDSPPEESFDRLSRLAAALTDAPVALVSLVDADRQFFKSCVGLPEPWASEQETPLSHSFCQYVVASREPLVIEDARRHPTLRLNLAVRDLNVVAYLGFPILSSGGAVLGSFCVIDSRPRRWTGQQIEMLRDLSASVSSEIALRDALRSASHAREAADRERREKTALLDSAGEGIYGVDTAGRATFMNRAAARMLGFEPEEVVGRNMHDLIHHTRANGLPYPEDECPVYLASRAGQPTSLTDEVLWRKDDTSFVAAYSSSPIREDGQIKGAVVTFTDVTERRRGERRLALQYAVSRALAESEQVEDALPRILEAVAEGMDWDLGVYWDVDAGADVLRCAASWRDPGAGGGDFLEKTRQAEVRRGAGLAGGVWADRAPVAVVDLTRESEHGARFRAAVDQGLRGAFAFPVQAGRDVLGVLEFFSHRQHAPDDDLVRAVTALGQQIGQFVRRKRTEEALRVADRALAATGTGITIADATEPGLPLTYANPAFGAITGYPPADVLGQNCRFLQGPETDPAAVEEIRAALREGRECRVVLRNYRRDGTPFWNDLSVSPVRDPSGALTHFIGVQNDVTRLKETEAELQRAMEEAESANQTKSQFLANMSHELRTPLNAIISYAELIEEEAADTGATAFLPDLQRILRAGKHLLGLISDVLDLSKVEAGKMDLYLEPVDVSTLVGDVVGTIKPQADRNENELVVRAPADVGTMRTDATKLRQALLNLLSNACKFTRAGTVRLDVECTSDGDRDWLVFRVTDSGIGLSQEQIDRLFQPFSQADASTTRRFGGTGLGLTITRHFCRLLGGDVEVESELGRGSTFTIRLPRDVVSPPEGAPEDGPLPEAAAQSNLVLVIDDDDAARDVLTRFLRREGFAVASAASGEQGLRLARQLTPIVILLDVMMPVMDGWTVLTKLKADPRLSEIPVVMLTMVDDRTRGFRLGATDYMVKPIRWEPLKSMLERYRSEAAPGRLLVVERDEATRLGLRGMLETQGWTVFEASDGQEALDCVASQKPDAILLDPFMPGINGLVFLDELARRPESRHVPVIVITGQELTPQERERLSDDVAGILRRGEYDRDELLREVRDVVARSAGKDRRTYAESPDR